jgi:hypothetical protein
MVFQMFIFLKSQNMPCRFQATNQNEEDLKSPLWKFNGKSKSDLGNPKSNHSQNIKYYRSTSHQYFISRIHHECRWFPRKSWTFMGFSWETMDVCCPFLGDYYQVAGPRTVARTTEPLSPTTGGFRATWKCHQYNPMSQKNITMAHMVLMEKSHWSV